MANICEPLINVVNVDKRKVLRRLNQNGEWSGPGAVVSPGADVAPPANRWGLTRTGLYTERGKPDAVPLGRGTARCTRCDSG